MTFKDLSISTGLLRKSYNILNTTYSDAFLMKSITRIQLATSIRFDYRLAIFSFIFGSLVSVVLFFMKEANVSFIAFLITAITSAILAKKAKALTAIDLIIYQNSAKGIQLASYKNLTEVEVTEFQEFYSQMEQVLVNPNYEINEPHEYQNAA